MKRRHVFQVIAFIMVFVMMANYMGNTRVEAAEPVMLYVESVKLFTAPTRDQAIGECKKAGYIPAEYDLNEGNGADAAVLGYKTTPDKDKAITDLAVLEMGSGYDIYSYADFQEKEMEKMGAVTAPYMLSLGEYRKNLEKGSPAAMEAQSILNLYYIPEKGDIGLGDFLADPQCKEDDIKKIFCQAGTGVLNAMFTNMVEGVADFEVEEGNWAERLRPGELDEDIEAAAEDIVLARQLDDTYKDIAMDLRPVVEEFSEKFTSAESYIAKYGEEALLREIEGQTDGEISGEVLEEITGNEAFADAATFVLYLTAYDILNRFSYNETTSLADYLVSLGKTPITTDQQLRKLYPLAKALTKGQFGVLRVVGLASMATSLVNDGLLSEKAETFASEMHEEILTYHKGEGDRLSIWEGVDRTIYESDVALTDEAKRSTYAAGDFSELVKGDSFDEGLAKLQTAAVVGGAMVSLGVAAITILVNVTFMATMGYAAFFETYGIFMFNAMTVWHLCFSAAMGSSIIGAVCGFLGCVVLMMSVVFAVISIVVLIVMCAKWIYEQFQDEDDTLEYTEDDIPAAVYDYPGGQYIQYIAVKDNATGKPCDLNGGEGRRFAALYYSRRTAAGMPIRVNPDGETFVLQKNNNYAPDGFAPVCYIGGSPANLNAYGAKKDAPALYLSYFVEKPKETEPGGETEPSGEEKARYLSSLSLTVEKTAAAARAELVKQGYTVIDQNLTNFLGVEEKLYTYLGYKTTDLASLSITDIRVIAGGNCPDSINYGAAVYSKAGETGAGGAAIYYTKSGTAGTPVYDDLQIISDKASAKTGFEPVNLFSGGPAYNFNANDFISSYGYAHLSRDRWNKDPLYIYFHPSVTYTSGDIYVGGMAFFTGCEIGDKDGDEILQYGRDLGYEMYEGYDFTGDYSMTVTITAPGSYSALSSGAHYVTYEDFSTYLGITKTYNPYRAIYAVSAYTAMPGTSRLQPAFYVPGEAKTAKEPAAGCGYAACGVYTEYIRRIDQDAYSLGSSVRGFSPNNSYIGRWNVAPDPAISLDDESRTRQDREEFERFGWIDSGPRLKNLYVCGKAEGLSPLTPDSFDLFKDPREHNAHNDEGFYCVGDLRVPNETGLHNLAYSSEHPVYLAVKREPAQAKLYVSDIRVASWDRKAAVGNDEQYAEMDEDEKKIYDREADDACIGRLRAECRDEILLRNAAVSFEASREGDPANTPERCSYVGVSRTDDVTKAIRSVIKFRAGTGEKPGSTVRVGGIRYTRAGDDPVRDQSGDYYIYYTTNTAVAPGEPITSIDFNALPMVEGAATALTAVEEDVEERKKGGEVIEEARYAELRGYANEANYLHTYFNTDKTRISDIYVGVGNTEKEAMLDLMNMGCSICFPLDMNKNTGGKYVLLGCDRYYSESAKDSYAVRDILMTVGHAAREEFELNGAVYIRARDRYIMNYDQSSAVSFNAGTNGLSIYLYYTADKTDEDLPPIRCIGGALKDFIPDNGKELVWENVMTTSGKRCNLNDGVFATEDGHSVDTRIYLFVNREGNAVKSGASLSGGSTMGAENLGGVGVMTFGSLYLE